MSFLNGVQDMTPNIKGLLSADFKAGEIFLLPGPKS